MSSSLLTGVRLSPSEAKFVRDGISQGLRSDGRGLLDSRHVEIRTSLLPQANGSARVRASFSATDVLCGIKFEVGTVDDASIQCTVELGALARADLFGPVEAAKRAERRGIELADLLLKWLEDTIEVPPLIPGKAKWVTFVDCLVFGDGGNLQDALSLASLCALRDAKIPETTVNEDKTDFDINPDYNSAKLLVSEYLSLTSTCWFISGRALMDPTAEEEACADCAVCVNLNRFGKLRLVSKFIGGGSVSPSALLSAVLYASKAAGQLLKFADSELDAAGARHDSRIGKLVVQDPGSWNEVCLSNHS